MPQGCGKGLRPLNQGRADKEVLMNGTRIRDGTRFARQTIISIHFEFEFACCSSIGQATWRKYPRSVVVGDKVLG